MGMERIYTCNICRDEVKDLNNLFGVNFSNLTKFKLCGYRSTEGTHICYRCAEQLKEQLNSPEISKLIK